jgi:hypothetical protein
MRTQTKVNNDKILMKSLFIHGLLLGILGLPAISYSYEIETHQEITRHAIKEAEIFKDQGKYLSDLGITNPYDPVGTKFPNSKFELLSIVDLFADGAKYEDIATACPIGEKCVKVFNHFFDPSKPTDPIPNQALSYKLGVFSISENNSYTQYDLLNPQSYTVIKSYTSSDWALEDKGIIDSTKWYGGGQNFSWRDARESFYLALTSQNEHTRQNYFGSVFQTLGHVVHHLQDMAQPQHVRNDIHNDIAQSGYSEPWDHRSLFESFTNNLNLLKTLPYTSYPSSVDKSWKPAYSSTDESSVFKQPRDFWAASDYSTSKKLGIAEFVNKNFFSAGTNYDSGYGAPEGSPTGTPAVSPVILNLKNPDYYNLDSICAGYTSSWNLLYTCNQTLLTLYGQTPINFYRTQVYNYRRVTNDIHYYATSESVFNADLNVADVINPSEIFTINWVNMRTALDFLIPEATAYSTGLINFFFRGKIDMVEDPDNPGQYLIKNLGNEVLKGTFELYYDDPNTKERTKIDNASWNLEIGSKLSSADNPTNPPITFTPPEPAPSSYMLVFKGDMGLETLATGGAVTGKVVLPQPQPPVWYIEEKCTQVGADGYCGDPAFVQSDLKKIDLTTQSVSQVAQDMPISPVRHIWSFGQRILHDLIVDSSGNPWVNQNTGTCSDTNSSCTSRSYLQKIDGATGELIPSSIIEYRNIIYDQDGDDFIPIKASNFAFDPLNNVVWYIEEKCTQVGADGYCGDPAFVQSDLKKIDLTTQSVSQVAQDMPISPVRHIWSFGQRILHDLIVDSSGNPWVNQNTGTCSDTNSSCTSRSYLQKIDGATGELIPSSIIEYRNIIYDQDGDDFIPIKASNFAKK